MRRIGDKAKFRTSSQKSRKAEQFRKKSICLEIAIARILSLLSLLENSVILLNRKHSITSLD